MNIEYAVIAAYLLVLVAIGFTFRAFNKDVSDYFRNGCKGTWWLVGASAFMSSFSAVTFTAMAGAAFESGLGVTIIFLGNALGFAVTAIWLAPWFRQLRAITAPEVIRRRFNPATQQFYAWVTMVLGVCYAALWLYGLAIFASAVFDFDGVVELLGRASIPIETELQAVIVCVGIVVLLYSVFGGSWAVMATDFLQFLILMPLTVLVAYVSLRAVGGFGGLVEQVEAQGLTRDFRFINEPGVFKENKYTLWFAVATIVYKSFNMMGINAAPRFFAVKDGAAARKAAWVGCAMMLLGTLVWFIPPMVARVLYAPEVMAMAEAGVEKPAEASYAFISMMLLPAGMTGLMAVAMFAATMSSMDSGLNRNSAIFVRDVLPIFCRVAGRDVPGERAQYRWGQAFSFLFGCVIITMALYFAQTGGKGVFENMLDVGALLALPMAVPMLLALFIRRVPSWAAIAALIGAMIPSVVAFLAGQDRIALEPFNYQQKVFWIVGVGAGVFLLTMPFWNTVSVAYAKKVDDFFEIMHRPVDFAAEVGPGNDVSQLRIMGFFAALVGAGVCLLTLIPQERFAQRFEVLFVGGFVVLAGLGLWWAGRVKEDSEETPPADSVVVEPPVA